jgi:probable rRNA maturation factor
MEQQISLQNRQRKVRLNVAWLRRFARAALEICRRHPAETGAVLPQLPQVEVTIISDEKMAAVHEQFLNAHKTTDVISFDHGEILISAETALANARKYRRRLEAEIALYIIHGLLHLNGYDDATAGEAKKMRRVQELAYQRCIKCMRRKGATRGQT